MCFLWFSIFLIMWLGNRNNFPSPFPIWTLAFLFLAIFPWLESAGQCWIQTVRVDILVLVLIEEGKLLSLWLLSTMLAVGLGRCPLACCVSFLLFLVYSVFLSWKGFGFCQILFCIYWNDVFLFLFMNIYIDWFSYIELTLYFWDKFNLVMVCNPFYMLLDFVC